MKLATVRLAEGTGRELPLGGLESDMTITTTTVWGRDGGEGGREGEGGRREEERERGEWYLYFVGARCSLPQCKPVVGAARDDISVILLQVVLFL